jgi:hypothetical protein
VTAAGGVIRGLSKPSDNDDVSKEVVQLKYMQRSNQDQMEKLYKLWRLEPQAIHHYLHRTIFPEHTRAQKVKISASGQSVGGDMLVGRRVGFSGTPSDLLPIEFGQCDYETGDDGKMLTTMLTPEIASYEYIEDGWCVEVLRRFFHLVTECFACCV